MAKSRSERQRQTQLAFAPLPSSSPARASQPEAVRDRAAAVTINMLPRPSRKKISTGVFLPTPSRSSQNHNGSLPEMTLGSSPSSRRSKKSFMSSGNTTYSPTSRKSQLAAPFEASDHSESDDSDSTPIVSQKKHIVLTDSDSDEVVVVSSSKHRKGKAVDGGPDSDVIKTSRQAGDAHTKSNHDVSDSDAVSLRPAKRARAMSVNEDSESEHLPARPAKKMRAQSKQDQSDSDIVTARRPGRRQSLSDTEHQYESEVMTTHQSNTMDSLSNEESSDSDVIITRPSRRVPTSSLPKFDSDSDVVNTQSSKESQQHNKEVATPISRSTRSAKARILTSKDTNSTLRTQSKDKEESEEEVIMPRSAKRLSRRVETVTPTKKRISRQDRDDLQEDLEFLKDRDTPPTTRKSSKQNAKQKALDALRRQRSKQKSKTTATSTNGRVVISSDEEAEDHSDVRDAEEISDDDFDEYTNMAPEELDVDDEDFIVEDENSLLGAPVDLPVQFSRYQTMKPADLFKFAVEWMVQKKINPAFEMDDEIYSFAFGRLDDFVKGMGGSKYQSSAWTSDFSKSLKSRPVLEHHRFINSGFEHDRCDACNRSGHPATWEVRFTGNCYDRNTLEEESDDDDDSDEESPNGPSASTTYYVGKFCMGNARTAHALAHWRFHLNEWVVDFLKDEGYCSSEKIVERDGWSIKKRRKYANKIVDKMQDAGEIKRLHRDFRNEINTAQYANDSHFAYSSP